VCSTGSPTGNASIRSPNAPHGSGSWAVGAGEAGLELTPNSVAVTGRELTAAPIDGELTAPVPDPSADRAVDAAEHPDASMPSAMHASVHNRFMSRPPRLRRRCEVHGSCSLTGEPAKNALNKPR
jgi:hypothetical protein